MRVEYHPETTTDLNGAIAHYNELRSGLGDALRGEVYAAINRVLSNPKQFPVVERDIRRSLVRRFPYSVLFSEPEPDLVRILVIRHHRRDQGFGLDRQ